MSLATFSYVPPVLILVASIAPLLSVFFDIELKYWLFAACVLVAGVGWTTVARRFRREYDDPTAALNVFAKENHGGQGREEIPAVQLQMPAIPRIWKPLMATSRPRQVICL